MSLTVATAQAEYMLDLTGMTNQDLLDEFFAESCFTGNRPTWRTIAIRTELMARMSS